MGCVVLWWQLVEAGFDCQLVAGFCVLTWLGRNGGDYSRRCCRRCFAQLLAARNSKLPDLEVEQHSESMRTVFAAVY